MEDTLTVFLLSIERKMEQSLNPCSNGRYSHRVIDFINAKNDRVS